MHNYGRNWKIDNKSVLIYRHWLILKKKRLSFSNSLYFNWEMNFKNYNGIKKKLFMQKQNNYKNDYMKKSLNCNN